MDSIATWFNDAVSVGNGLIWGKLLVYLLIGAGLYFTVMTRGIQFRFFGHMFALLKGSRDGGEGISSFQALSTSLAARVGTGNLAGVAVAIYLGGPGAIFWMWMTALVGMATSFVESTLAQAYKVDHGDKTFRGGPARYIERGLGQRWMAIAFSICLIIAFGLAFNSVQANSIAQAMEQAFNIPTWIVGIALLVGVTPIIFGGLRSIAKVAELIVPLMALLYLILALVVVALNIDELPSAIALIFNSAFGLEEAAGGAVGYAVAQAMMQGIKRGLFSNEAGMGSTPNAAATAEVKHPATQGLVQAFGVVIDTLVICTCTAVVILLSGVYDQMLDAHAQGASLQGIKLTQDAMFDHLGLFGQYFIGVAILFFAYSSILANFAYTEINVEYLFKKNGRRAITILRPFILAMVAIGSVASLDFVWHFADLAMGLMATTNLVAILLLFPIALRVLRDYERQRAGGTLRPVFNKRVLKHPEQVEPGIWD